MWSKDLTIWDHNIQKGRVASFYKLNGHDPTHEAVRVFWTTTPNLLNETWPLLYYMALYDFNLLYIFKLVLSNSFVIAIYHT